MASLAALAVLAPEPALGAAAGAAVVAHAWWRRPRRPPAEVRRLADGRWAVPALGVRAAVLGEGTRYARAWARLELVERARRPITLLLLRDQLDAEGWRLLQTELRRAAAGTSGEGSLDFR